MNGWQYRVAKQYVERRRTSNWSSGSQQRLAINRNRKTTKLGHSAHYDVEMIGFFFLSMRDATILRRVVIMSVARGRIMFHQGMPTHRADLNGGARRAATGTVDVVRPLEFSRNRKLEDWTGG